MKALSSLAVCCTLFGSLASADVRLPALVSDQMVLQRNDMVNIWGFASPGEAVSVVASWSGKVSEAVADEQGNWSVRVATGDEQGPQQLTIQGKNTLTVSDILLGEVWVCGGQSNMEWPLGRLTNYSELIAGANHPDIRLFTVKKKIAYTPEVDCVGTWQACTPEVVKDFSAVGFLYGRELSRELGVPIGLISCNWGGTVAEAWTSESTLASWQDFQAGLAAVREMAGDLEGVEASSQERLAKWWDDLQVTDPGQRSAWQADDFDDSDWRTMQVPGGWTETPLSSFDGLVWMRRSFEIPAEWDGLACMLNLGPIDDMDSAWLNGVRVGGMENTGMWQTDRTYKVPAGVLRTGQNVVAVRVYDSGGEGGMTGRADQLSIAPLETSHPVSLAGAWHYQDSLAQAKLASWPITTSSSPNRPTVLFNGMLAPVTPFGIRGAIWYQGESNVGRAEQYSRLFPAMIEDWRVAFGRPEFPFYYVQIAPFNYGASGGAAAELREAQRLSLSTPATGMAVTMDIGNPSDIHPVNKLDVGKRLALWALTKTYGRDVGDCSGPLFERFEVESHTLRIHFTHAADGLGIRADGTLTHFEVAGSDGVFVPATATIDGSCVLVQSSKVPSPTAVRYAWGHADEPNLMNKAGLPASSFRSSGW